jgi:hypothetical protein
MFFFLSQYFLKHNTNCALESHPKEKHAPISQPKKPIHQKCSFRLEGFKFLKRYSVFDDKELLCRMTIERKEQFTVYVFSKNGNCLANTENCIFVFFISGTVRLKNLYDALDLNSPFVNNDLGFISGDFGYIDSNGCIPFFRSIVDPENSSYVLHSIKDVLIEEQESETSKPSIYYLCSLEEIIQKCTEFELINSKEDIDSYQKHIKKSSVNAVVKNADKSVVESSNDSVVKTAVKSTVFAPKSLLKYVFIILIFPLFLWDMFESFCVKQIDSLIDYFTDGLDNGDIFNTISDDEVQKTNDGITHDTTVFTEVLNESNTYNSLESYANNNIVIHTEELEECDKTKFSERDNASCEQKINDTTYENTTQNSHGPTGDGLIYCLNIINTLKKSFLYEINMDKACKTVIEKNVTIVEDSFQFSKDFGTVTHEI